jgi:dephospho-CoA kinase
VLLEIQLLLETRDPKAASTGALGIEAVVVVYAPEETMIERQIARNGYDREEALRRIRAQLPIEEKRAMADYVIDNSGSREETERQVEAVMKRLLRNNSGTGDGRC